MGISRASTGERGTRRAKEGGGGEGGDEFRRPKNKVTCTASSNATAGPRWLSYTSR